MSIPKHLLTINLNPVVKSIVIFTAGAFGVMYFLTAIPRILYPYDLDFVEDGMLMASWRLALGQSIFVQPQADFVPHVYMPLYAWLGGLLFRIAGPGFVPLRLLSLASVLVSCSLIFWVAQRESGQNWLGLVCAGLFLGGYRINGFWYELARVDSLFVALAMTGLALGTYGANSRSGLVGSAIALACAFLTKQTGLILGFGMGIFLLGSLGRQAWPYWLSYGLVTIVPVVLLNSLSGGWFLYYTYHIASINPIEFRRLASFIGYELPVLMGGLSLIAIGTISVTFRQAGLRGMWQQPWLIWLGLSALISGMGRVSVGGNLNNRMLVYTVLCLTPALLTHNLTRYTKSLSQWQFSLISILILVQFTLGVYNPLRYIPTPAMRQSGQHLIEKISAEDGEVLVLMHPYYAWLAGKTPAAQIAAMWHARERGALPLPLDFARRIETLHYTTIIADNSLFEIDPEFQQLLNTYYTPVEIMTLAEAPPTNTGMIVRPEVVYRPK